MGAGGVGVAPGRDTEGPGKPMDSRETRENLESRIKDQFPALFITLVSVLIGLVLADLVAEARTRMHLWPITLSSLRTWFQLAGNGFSALVAWVIYAHIGISRRRIPSLADASIAFILPLTLLFGTSFVGIESMWPWLYFASCLLLFSLLSTIWLLHIMRLEETELASFSRLRRPGGFLSIFAMGIPFYGAAGWADRHGYLSPLLEVVCAATPAPAAMIVCHLFMRDWRYAISGARATGPD
jgi:hypothetical protein